MSTELATMETNPNKINKMFGFSGKPKPTIPVLKIGSEDEEKGVTPPKGSFMYDDGDRVLYSRAITIRVFSQRYQYRLYDSTDKAKTDMSIIGASFREEFISMSGRLACGKMSNKSFQRIADTATAQQKYFQDNVKCKLILFGLVSGTFQDLETNEQVDIENVPFVWVMPQSGFMTTSDTIKGIEQERRAVPQTPIAVSTKKEKMGATTFFIPVYQVMKTTEPMVAERDMAVLKSINTFVSDTNKSVQAKYEQATSGNVQNMEFAEVTEVTNMLNDPLDL